MTSHLISESDEFRFLRKANNDGVGAGGREEVVKVRAFNSTCEN